MSNIKHSPKPPTVSAKDPLSESAILNQLEKALEFLSLNVNRLSDNQLEHAAAWLREEKKKRAAEVDARRPKVGDQIVITGGRFKDERAQVTSLVARKQYVLVTFAKEGMRPDVVHLDDMVVFKPEA